MRPRERMLHHERGPISYLLERYFVAARRFSADPIARHRPELESLRRSVRADLAAAGIPSGADLRAARHAATKQRHQDRMYRLCFCARCHSHRNALKLYVLGFRDGVCGRVRRRRLDATLRSFKQHYRRGLADARRMVDHTTRAYESSLEPR